MNRYEIATAATASVAGLTGVAGLIVADNGVQTIESQFDVVVPSFVETLTELGFASLVVIVVYGLLRGPVKRVVAKH